MSTVPPPPVVLPLLGDELPLLLQPAAAKAITARAAIAEVRFIFFIFLSLDRGHPAAVKHAFWPPSGCSQAGRTSPRATWPEICRRRGETRRQATDCGRATAISLR